MRYYRGYDLRIHIQHTALLSLLLAEIKNLIPESLCIIGRPFEEGIIPVIRRIVPLYEITDIDLLLPYA